MSNREIIEKVKNTLIIASSTFSNDKKNAYTKFIMSETNERAKWILETILQNANVAEKQRSPLCDDTGIPHVVLEIGPNSCITGNMIRDIKQGIAEGLVELPGRPMGLLGNDEERIDQSGGVSTFSDDVLPAPILLKEVEEDVTRLNILMFGGGPAIRGKTYRIFHKHDVNVVIDEIIEWAKEAVSLLGCSPCTLAIGIGRSQYEATALMLEAMTEGNYNIQSDIEKKITKTLNETGIGPLGLKGDISVLATFLKIGPQRSSGVRIVCLRPCCCYEPRIASVEL